MFDKQNYRRVAGLAGAITQSGAVIKSVQSDVRHDPGMPVKLSSGKAVACLLYTSPSPRDRTRSRMPSSA